MSGHIPVMLDHVVEHMSASDGDVLLDGTFGGGGYTRALLESASCTVLGVDRDPDALKRSAAVSEQYGGRFHMLAGRFGDTDTLCAQAGFAQLDGAVFDLGVSSFQLDEDERGFSFMRDGPLDMRMSQNGPSAADVVNAFRENDLADIIFQLGEERESRRIARRIVEARSDAPFESTLQLAEVIEKAVGGRRGKRTHPATKSFQALRMYVNDELGELARALMATEKVLKPGGRLIVVTFHSLEDRMVKTFMAERSGKTASQSRFMPAVSADGPAPSFEYVRKISAPETAEVAANARARSSRLRSAVRTAGAAWSGEVELPTRLPDIDEVL
jgi:16S rRNA (cytosine1402-N4)-methyltransferase